MADDIDRAQIFSSFEMDALNYRLLKERNSDLEALRKVTIRPCVECGATIPMKRLLLVPRTTLCIDCKKEFEDIPLKKY